MARSVGSTKGQKKKADVLYSKIIRLRGRCEDCGSTDWLQTAHIISRRFSNTRTDLRNAFCLCAGCHHRYTDHPVEFARFVENSWAGAFYTQLLKKSQLTTKVNWQERVEFLKDVYQQLQDEELTLDQAREYEE